ncbi:MAG: hypothetical protein MI923_15055 [Phycisphaerales bacterium]|nr:hypothetical protein [Phycisphaerales bacterium]
MQESKRAQDRFSRWLLVAIAMLLAVNAVGLWDNRTSILPTAQAQIPDTAKQRQQLVKESRRTNELLSQILTHLRTKAIKVQIEATDKREGSRAPGSTRRR